MNKKQIHFCVLLMFQETSAGMIWRYCQSIIVMASMIAMVSHRMKTDADGKGYNTRKVLPGHVNFTHHIM